MRDKFEALFDTVEESVLICGGTVIPGVARLGPYRFSISPRIRIEYRDDVATCPWNY